MVPTSEGAPLVYTIRAFQTLPWTLNAICRIKIMNESNDLSIPLSLMQARIMHALEWTCLRYAILPVYVPHPTPVLFRDLLGRWVIELVLNSSVKAGLHPSILPEPFDDFHQFRGHGALLNGVRQVIELPPIILQDRNLVENDTRPMAILEGFWEDFESETVCIATTAKGSSRLQQDPMHASTQAFSTLWEAEKSNRASLGLAEG